MNGISLMKVCIIHFILLALFSSQTKAQDSLYLVGTLTGESTDKNITNVCGIGDINGDGYDDFMVSTRTGKKVRDQGIVKLYLGSADGNLIDDVTFHYPGIDSMNVFGQIVSGLEDINHDGYNDFAIGGGFGDWGFIKGKVFIYFGGQMIDTIPKYEFHEPWIEDSFGNNIEALGDINKDGYDDFIIGAPYNWSNGRGYAYLFWGGDTISWERCDTISGNLFYPQSFANIGDINNDSYDDIAIGVFEQPSYSDSGKVFIYFGGNQMDTQPDTVITSDSSGYDFGRIIKNAGDLNNDGIVDFCIAGYPHIKIYTNLFNEPIWIDGYSMDANGDINNDGYDDLIVGSELKINIYFGSNSFDALVPDIVIDDSLRYSTQFIKLLGDINKDGYDEITSFAPNYPNTENPQGKVYIYSYQKITDVKKYKDNTPQKFKLFQNFPNPFNPSTIINYQLTIESYVTIKLYNVLGKEIATLVNKEQLAGKHKVKFDASKYNLSSGIYFCQLNIEGGSKARIKLVLIK